jgi:predicted DNA binding protein
MSVIAEFTLSGDDFILGQVLGHPSIKHIEMERVVPTSRRLIPYVWVHGGEFDEFEASLRTSDNVEEVTQIDRVDASALYRVEWVDEVDSIFHAIAETDATILEARGLEEWFFRVRFENHTGLAAFNNICQEIGIRFELERVYTLTNETSLPHFDLTDAQRRTLLQAVGDGYFEVPRRTTLGEIGAKLDISEQSASENLRRGVNSVLRAVLFDSPNASV